MLALALIVCLITVPLAGGRLSALADVQLRRPWLAAAGISLQVVVLAIAPGAVGELGAPLHVASYALLGAFAWSNRRLAGVPLIALGGALNALVIVVNGGVMPADPDAIARAAGRTVREGGEFSNSAPATDPTLGFLGDVIATPAGGRCRTSTAPATSSSSSESLSSCTPPAAPASSPAAPAGR